MDVTLQRTEASSTPLLDRAYLARFTLGNLALEREVLGLFAAQAPSYYSRMIDAASTQDWLEAAHTLKGSAGAVGATTVAELAEAVERITPPETSDARRHLCADLARAIDATCTEIAAIAP
jgi:HPt (histidine-containing phosphotransfer) domain-containing protein